MVRPFLVPFLTLFLGIASTAWAQEAKISSSLRLALVSSTPGENINNLLDLAQAKLSGQPRLEMLERKAIQKILAEQKLSLAGLVDSNLAVQAGKLLSANVFALIETDPQGKEALGLVIYDAETGIKWYDQTLTGAAVDQQVEAIAQAVRGVAKKRAAGPQDWRTLCILGARNADLPRSQDHVVSTVAWLLERHLLTSPSLAVLERKRLDWVNKEKNLTSTNKELLASLVMVDVEISRAEKGIKATVHLTDARGKNLGKINSQSAVGDSKELASGLLAGIFHELQTSPIGAVPDRHRESQRFFQEGLRSITHKVWSSAIHALEAGYALDPDNEQVRAELVKTFIISAFWKLELEQSQDLAANTALVKEVLANGLRGFELRLLALEQSPPTAAGLGSFRKGYNDSRFGLNEFGLNRARGKAIDKECEELRRQVFSTYLRMSREELSRAAKIVKETSPQVNSIYRIYAACFKDFQIQTKDQEFFSPSELEEVSFEALKRWLEIIEMPGCTLSPQDVNLVLQNPFDESPRFAELHERLSKHADPLVQLWGRYLFLKVQRKHDKIAPAEADAAYQAIKQAALMAIVKFQPPKEARIPAADLRYGCYEFLFATTQTWPFRDVDTRHHERFALCKFMLQRNEIVLNVLRISVNKPDDPWTKSLFFHERWDLIEQAQKVLARGKPALLENPAWLRQTLAEARATVLRECPDIAGRSSDPMASGPWKKVRLLFRADTIPHAKQVSVFTVQGHEIFLPICRTQAKGGSECWVDVLKISLREDTGWKTWAQWKVPTEAGEISHPSGEILASCWGDDQFYVGTQHGIFVVDNQGSAKNLTKDIALPTIKARSLAFLQGKLFAGLEGGYLVSLDPKTRQFETLASSRRRDPLSPFDNREEFQLCNLNADGARNRLLILLYQYPKVIGKYSSSEYPTQDTTNGLWEYNLKTKKFTRHLELYFEAVIHASISRPEHWLLSHTNNDNAIDFDMATNRCVIHLGAGSVGPSLPGTPKPRLTTTLPYYQSYWQHQDTLWGVNSFTFVRITLKDGRTENFPGFIAAHGQQRFLVAPALQSVPENCLLVQNLTGLWLVELSD